MGSDLQDSFGRKFSYLRLSLTDVCNFRCIYCLPDGYQRTGLENNVLRKDEIIRLVRAFSDLGLWKVRLTGGEPTVRKDFVEIAEGISNLPKVKKLALSTNAFKLEKNAKAYKEAGISALNISIDSLDANRFYKITGQNRCKEVVAGIEKALELGFDSVKTNTVLMKDLNDQDLDLFLEWIKHRPVSVRFIELMLTGENQNLYKKHHLSMSTIYKRLIKEGWSEIKRNEGDGPARTFGHPQYKGSIGCIAPYAKNFCDTCNRLRVTSYGKLRLCLFSSGADYSLRDFLQSDEQIDDLKQTIINVLSQKKESHNLHKDDYGTTRNFSAIGG